MSLDRSWTWQANLNYPLSEPAADGSGSEEEKTGKIGTKKAKKIAAKAEKKEQREVMWTSGLTSDGIYDLNLEM